MPHPQQTGPQGNAPFNPLPPVIVVLFVLMVGIEAIFSLGAHGLVGGPGAVGWRLDAVQDWGFNGQILRWMLATGQWPPDQAVRLVTYSFINGSFSQTLFAGVMLLAVGKMVGEAFSALATLAIFFGSAIGGALAYGLLMGDPHWLVGAFPAVYGLIGAFTYLLWTRLGDMGERQLTAFRLIGVLLALQLIFGLLSGASNTWIADVGGFASGFALSLVVRPGGWRALRARLRRS